MTRSFAIRHFLFYLFIYYGFFLSPTNNTCILRFARFDANADVDVDADADAIVDVAAL